MQGALGDQDLLGTGGYAALLEPFGHRRAQFGQARRLVSGCEQVRAQVGDAPFAKVRLLSTDVHDVDGLTMIASQIFPDP